MRHLKAPGRGEYLYDYRNDILLFKIRDRNYAISVEFDNFIVDIDEEGFITGLRIFDASQIFKLSKVALNNLKSFEFHAKAENGVISVQLRFDCMVRNAIIKQGHDFVREAADSHIKNSEVICTVA
ncbi:DUF2283 domain-containing protein [Candidatus Woesearchaeota archaeon]|nr:DUF2283 domain-containing protein [Candidatus Woesearchaeota archaeon]